MAEDYKSEIEQVRRDMELEDARRRAILLGYDPITQNAMEEDSRLYGPQGNDLTQNFLDQQQQRFSAPNAGNPISYNQMRDEQELASIEALEIEQARLLADEEAKRVAAHEERMRLRQEEEARLQQQQADDDARRQADDNS